MLGPKVKDEWMIFGCASALTFCLLYATMAGLNVFNEIRLTAQELNSEMGAFKQSSEDLWSELVKIEANIDPKLLRDRRQAYQGSGYSASLAVETPPPRKQQAEICNCQVGKENKCPKGPPGLKGPKGETDKFLNCN